MKEEIEKLEKVTQEIDYLFQEGVVMTIEEHQKALALINQLELILNDPFLRLTP